MANGWEQLLSGSFAQGTYGNLLANLISSAAVEIYSEWRKRSHTRTFAAGLSRVTEAVESLLVEAEQQGSNALDRQSAIITRFASLPATETALIDFGQFMQTRDFESLVTEVVCEYILYNKVGPATIRNIALTLELHALPSLPSQLVDLVSSEIAEIIVLTISHSIRNEPENFSLKDEVARTYLQRSTQDRLIRRVELLTRLLERESKDIRNIGLSATRLRKSVAAVHSTMRPPSLESAKKVALQELYVGPTLVFNGGDQYQIPESLATLLTQSPRLVILGNPGGGKTSLVNYMAYVTSSTPSEDTVTLPIVLREHSAEVLASGGLNLLKAAATTAHAKYQVSVSEAELEYLCIQNRTLIILDGLDEFLELDHRISVTSAIEAFTALYPECRIVVTSREVGYEASSIDRRLFDHVTLAPFDDTQVRKYAENWFHQSEELTSHLRVRFVDSFMTESESIKDLRNNPLMLSLLCGLYRHQRSLPSNRPELYEKCSTLMFDTWDRRRRLRPKFEFDAHVKFAIQHIAFWMFQDQERHSGVREDLLVREAAKYFKEWLYDDEAVAISSAHEFVDFCRNRAWVLSDSGLTDEGALLFQFTHRTFMEYFAALHLNHTLSDSEVTDVIVAHCADGPWNVVLQILTQIAWQRRQGLADTIVNELCKKAESLPLAEQAIVDELCVRIAESVPLRPGTVRAVAERAMTQFGKPVTIPPTRPQRPARPMPGRSQFLLDSSKLAVENYRAARGVVIARLVDIMRTSETPLREVAYLIQFALIDECSPTDLRDSIPSEIIEVLRQKVSGPWSDAWVECSALLLQMAFSPSGVQGMLLGNRLPTPISSVKSLWGDRDLPNGSEIISWLLVHDQLTEPASAFELMCDELSRTALEHVSRLTQKQYSPHSIWFALQRVPEKGASSELPKMPLLLLLSLVENHVGDTADEDEREETLLELISQPWGRCALVPSMIARRYGVRSRPSSSALKREAERLGVDAWGEGENVSAVQLAQRMGE